MEGMEFIWDLNIMELIRINIVENIEVKYKKNWFVLLWSGVEKLRMFFINNIFIFSCYCIECLLMLMLIWL